MLSDHSMLMNSVRFGSNFAEFESDHNIDGILEVGLQGAKFETLLTGTTQTIIDLI